MRVDPRILMPGDLQPDRVGETATNTAQQTRNATERPQVDTVRLSSDHEIVNRLRAELDRLPEIRADRVEALQTAIQQGTYKPTHEQVAEAILKDLL